jgi:prevent-host-death family protein
MMDHMRTTSLVAAKAHLSELVDEAEHKGRRILILRHGKPAAAIVPVAVAIASEATRTLSAEQAERRLGELVESMSGDARESAVRDLLDGRG